MSHPLPLIAISSDLTHWPDDQRRLVSQLYHTYVDAVSAAGCIPLPTTCCRAAELALLCDGLILAGGEDIDPAYYGETVLNDTVKCVPRRDAFEWELLAAFRQQGKPVLGICRGCQVINVALGGTLYQDLPQQKGLCHAADGLCHPITAAEGSLLCRLFGPRFLVNSIHHQAIRDLAPGLQANAWAEDGIVEAFVHESEPIWGTQFHPERLTGPLRDDRTPDFAPLFRAFVQLVRDTEASIKP